MPKYRIRCELTVEADDREQAVEFSQTGLREAERTFSWPGIITDAKVTGTEEIK